MSNPQELIQAVISADSAPQLIAAVRDLASARLEAGISTLIAVLGYNNPAAAAIALEGLILMGDVAVIPILQKIDGYNYGARAYAIQALSAIADPRALEVLIKAAATDFAPSVRRSAAKGLGNLRWNLLPAAEIPTAQRQVFETLKQVSEDSDWSIRYAAIVGLQALASKGNFPEIISHLQKMTATETDPAIQARVQLAINS